MPKFGFGALESRLYDFSICVTGHKHYYDSFFSQSNLRLVNGDRVLDAGCGTGMLSVGLLKEYVVRRGIDVMVQGFDMSEQMLGLAYQNACKRGLGANILLYLGDGQNLMNVKEFDKRIETQFDNNSFDLVMSSGMLEYVSSPEKAVSEMSRVLKPGKQLVLSFVNDNLLGRGVSKLWGFKILSKGYLLGCFREIKSFEKFNVDSPNPYMKLLKSIYVCVKS